MRNFYILLIILLLFKVGYSQTCTVTGTNPLNWANPGPSCVEGGNASGKSILVIPSGFTLVFDSNGDTWTGARIDVYGILLIDKDVTINSNITVHSGGLLRLQSKLSIGTSAGCGYGLAIKTGGTVDVGDTGSDRLSICGKELMKGHGSCNSCGGDNSGDCPYEDSKPYCEPAGGFQGPLGYDENGYNGTLPIKLLSLSAHQEANTIDLRWSTASEENFDKFIIEHSSDGRNFDSIGAINGAGNSQVLLKYSFSDSNPVIGKNYYRLKSIDFDKRFEYSYLVLAEFEGKKNVNIFPNPTRGTSIQVRTNFTPSVGDRVEIYDNVGLKLMEFNVSEVESSLLFNRMLKQGSYLLRYISNDHVQVIRFSCNN